MCRYYALAVAATLVLLGLAVLLGILSWEWGTGLYYLAMGLVFAYPGLFARDREGVRQMVEGLGILLILVTVTVIVIFLLAGTAAYWGPVETVALVVGSLSILAAKILRDVQTG